MLYCGMNGNAHAAQSEAMHAHGPATPGATEHAAHAHHSNDAEQAVAKHVAAPPHDTPSKLPDTAHKCGVCSACYNTLGTTSPPLAVTAYATPNTRHIEPQVQAYAAPLRLPEKPPRA